LGVAVLAREAAFLTVAAVAAGSMGSTSPLAVTVARISGTATLALAATGLMETTRKGREREKRRRERGGGCRPARSIGAQRLDPILNLPTPWTRHEAGREGRES